MGDACACKLYVIREVQLQTKRNSRRQATITLCSQLYLADYATLKEIISQINT